MSYLVGTRGHLDHLGDSIVIDDAIELEPVRLGDDEFAARGPARFHVTLRNVGEGIIADGSVSATFQTTCVRCLCSFDTAVSAAIDAYYVRADQEAGLPEEQERQLIVDERIDLEPAVVESLVVELPFAPLHDASCSGLCPTCGADLNEGPCGCDTVAAASPFARLKDVLGASGLGATDDGAPDDDADTGAS